ncbi:aminotransferase [Rhodococcus hoagii]|uniref:aminotransferase n=1 Tax=Rhodococcus hoagii TaxID=43767 RepID=UPI0019629C1A|nr:aminotransferase [Prescottella equi]MBM9838750.1 aminotransferase [Prescottella equi]
MALTEASAHAGVDSVPPPGGFLQLFMEANRLAGRAVSGSVPDRGVDIAGDRRPE